MTDLLLTQGGMACGNALPLRVGEWIQHAVMRMNRGKSVLGQLLINQLYYLGHAGLVVTPVTDDLGREHSQSHTCVAMPTGHTHLEAVS